MRDLKTGEMTLPELASYIEHLPVGSAVWCVEHGMPFGWTLTDVLISDIYAALVGNPHPARAEVVESARVRDAVARLKAQRERLNSQP